MPFALRRHPSMGYMVVTVILLAQLLASALCYHAVVRQPQTQTLEGYDYLGFLTASTASQSHQAYVTLLQNDRKYLDQALVLTYSIRLLGCYRDMVILYSGAQIDQALPSYAPVLNELRIRMVRMEAPLVDPLQIKSQGYRDYMAVNPRYTALLNKVYLFLLVEYSKVMYVDTNMMARQHIEWMWDNPDCSFPSASKAPISTSWFVAKPGRDTFQTLVEEVVTGDVTVTEGFGGAAVQYKQKLQKMGGQPKDGTPFRGALSDQGLLYHYWVDVRQCSHATVDGFQHFTGGCGEILTADPRDKNSAVLKCGEWGGIWMEYYSRVLNSLLVSNVNSIEAFEV